jgi:hypothetical protein
MATSKNATAGKKAGRRAIDPVVTAVIGLAEIVAAGANGIYTAPAVHLPLVEAGLVEINPAMTNENGEVATRATQKGIESLDSAATVADNATSETQTAATGETQKVKTMFKIEANIPVPTISGRGRGGNVYPFDQLEAGQSFFVANDESKPNAAKSLASTVSSATARYAVPAEDGSIKTNKKGEVVPVMVETRKFVVRSVEENGVKGARIWRTA